MDEYGARLHQIRVNHPNAAKIAKLSGPDAERLADLAIHRADLKFAKSCTRELASLQPPQESVIAAALFRSAVVAWGKCFNRSDARRFALDFKEIYPEGDLCETAEQAKAFRNKHIAHDDNPLSQSIPIAVIDAAESDRKVMKVETLTVVTSVATRGSNLDNLNSLLDEALRWVDDEKARISQLISDDLESRPYTDLLSLPEPSVTPPTADDMTRTRQR